MEAQQRRKQILESLTSTPISATALGKKLGASRQLIVGDVAILRAKGKDIIATPRGYIIKREDEHYYSVALKHSLEDMLEEMNTIVDCGCGLINVTVDHVVYGQLEGNLHVFTKQDAIDFVENLKENRPLCEISGNVHNHKLFCPSEKHYNLVLEKLKEKGFLYTSD